jgi:hypothetical protein
MGQVVQVPADPKGCNSASASDHFGFKSKVMSGGYPPLPGDKPFTFNDLRAIMACKYFITKGLPLNLGKQTS